MPEPFCLEEATIDGLHAAIRAGQITCVEIVQRYIERARAYNGVCSVLVTGDGGPVREARGAVRAGAPLRFPTQTVRAATILPVSTNTKARRSNSAGWSRPRPTRPSSSNTG